MANPIEAEKSFFKPKITFQGLAFLIEAYENPGTQRTLLIFLEKNVTSSDP